MFSIYKYIYWRHMCRRYKYRIIIALGRGQSIGNRYWLIMQKKGFFNGSSEGSMRLHESFCCLNQAKGSPNYTQLWRAIKGSSFSCEEPFFSESVCGSIFYKKNLYLLFTPVIIKIMILYTHSQQSALIEIIILSNCKLRLYSL